MAILLLPKVGTNNTQHFDNNFTVSKDGNPWSDGGSDTFDGTQGAQVSSPNGWVRLGGNTYTTSDGSIDVSKALGSDAVDLGVYSGWAIKGIWVCEIELGHEPIEPLNLRFYCNTGYDGANATGMVTRPFDIDGVTYELKTAWSTNSTQDGWTSTGETQLTVTIVPYLAEHNLPGANDFDISVSGDSITHYLNGLSRGATLYIQWSKVNVADVQDWIIADLVASEEFNQAPHERTLLVNTAPSAKLKPLNPLRGPNSDRWNNGVGYDPIYRFAHHSPQNIYFGGNGTIRGTIKKSGTPNQPLQRKVQLYSAHTNLLVAETWSDSAGNYVFDQLDADQHFTVVSHDYEDHFRSVIANDLKPVVAE
jgi:hypothetical protein